MFNISGRNSLNENKNINNDNNNNNNSSNFKTDENGFVDLSSKVKKKDDVEDINNIDIPNKPKDDTPSLFNVNNGDYNNSNKDNNINNSFNDTDDISSNRVAGKGIQEVENLLNQEKMEENNINSNNDNGNYSASNSNINYSENKIDSNGVIDLSNNSYKGETAIKSDDNDIVDNNINDDNINNNDNGNNDDIISNDENKNEKKKKKNDSINFYNILTERITGMGYNYSMLNLLKTIFFFSFIIIVCSYFHKLNVVYIIVLITAFLFMVPFSVYFQYKYLYEQKRFNQLKTYLKFMRLNFKQYQKIIIALRETKENFTEGEDEIYDLIEKAINYIETGHDFRSSLDIIEGPFKNSYITKLHSYIILAETEGGQSALEALDTIDFENWESDTYIFQTQKYKYQNQNSLYTLIGLGISLATIYIFNKIVADPATVEIFGNIFLTSKFQLATFIYILTDLMSYVAVKSMITGKWVKEDE